MTTKIRSSLKKVQKFIAFLIESFWVQFAAVSATYGFVVTIYLVLYFIVGERWFIISIGNNFLPLVTMFCILTLLITLVMPRYRFIWSLYSLPGVIAFFLWYGGLVIPSAAPASDPEAIELTVATYNTAMEYSAVEYAVNDGFDADIVGLQEVLGVSFGTDNLVRSNDRAIYTRSPIIIEAPKPIYRIGTTSTIIAAKVKVNINSKVVSVYSFHAFRPKLNLRPFLYDSAMRSTDIRSVMDAIAQDPNPVILFCDCNFSDKTDDYQLISTYLTDSWMEQGFGLGLTSKGGFPFLLLRSDYIWHSDDFETVSIDVLPVELSDHYPVRARLRFRAS